MAVVKDPDQLPLLDPGQGMLPGLGPVVGDRWCSIHTNTIATVLSIAQRRYGWVTLRIRGEHQTLRIDKFLEHFELYKSPNGRQR